MGIKQSLKDNDENRMVPHSIVNERYGIYLHCPVTKNICIFGKKIIAMTFEHTYILSNEKQLLIKLPENFKKGQKVLVSVKEADEGRAKKINMLANAATDPLFVSDMNEIREDFRFIDAD